MGRGRAKAKQAKVARQLKYQTSDTSIEDLREEMGAAPTPTVPAHDAEDLDELYSDPYDSDEADDESYDGPQESEDDPYGEWADSYARDMDGGQAGQPSRG